MEIHEALAGERDLVRERAFRRGYFLGASRAIDLARDSRVSNERLVAWEDALMEWHHATRHDGGALIPPPELPA